jgi:transcriptional regulator with XRE-family HTH domain
MATSKRTKARTQKAVTEPAFAARLVFACNRNGAVPPPNYGRLGWIKKQLATVFDEPVSEEAVRRWLSGEGKPRLPRIRYLAQILNVDAAWLAFGETSPGVREDGAPFQENHDEVETADRGSKILERIRERLGGTVRVAPGVDLTAPTGEIWDAERD